MTRPHKQVVFTFGSGESGSLTLDETTEQYTNQVGCSDFSQLDLRPVYAPAVTNDGDVKLATRVYVSSDPITTIAGDSTWHPVCSHDNDGSGNYDPVIDVYRAPALAADVLKLNANIQLFLGAKKMRVGFQEEGSPSSDGSVSSFGGTFRI